jgi:hypothetical protein
VGVAEIAAEVFAPPSLVCKTITADEDVGLQSWRKLSSSTPPIMTPTFSIKECWGQVRTVQFMK